MKLYDELIGKVKDLAENGVLQSISEKDAWKEGSSHNMILRSDMAYELGSEKLPAVGITLITDSTTYVPKDAVFVVGSDLGDIKEDCPYARIAIVRVDEETIGEGEKLYNAIRKLEFTRYHFTPEGFMLRVSSSKHRESVRVSKAAVANGISFAKVGELLIKALHKHPGVLSVQLIYATDPNVDYKVLSDIAKESEKITQTISHIFQNVTMDCNSCNLQEVCDEVEGLKELHFARQKEE